MATNETVYTVRAQAKDFDKVGQAVDKLAQQIRNGPNKAMAGGVGERGGTLDDRLGAFRARMGSRPLEDKLKAWQERVRLNANSASVSGGRGQSADESARRAKVISEQQVAVDKRANKELLERLRLTKEYLPYAERMNRVREREAKLGPLGGGGAGGIGNVIRFSGGGGGGGEGGGGAGDGGPSFRQGLLQAITPQAFIERGPGMYRQAAGNLVGQGLRGFGQAGMALLGSSITGSQSIVNFANSLPYGLGVLASPISAAISAGNQNIQTRRAMSGLMPYMFGTGEGANALTRLNLARTLSGNAAQGLGMSHNEAVQTLAQAAAGTGIPLMNFSHRAQAAALQAQAGYGVDAGAGLSLFRGEMVGAGRAQGGTPMLSQAISDARRMGLGGADIGRYVEQIAQRLEQFNETGLKVSAAGQGGVGTAIGALTGATGRRAFAMTQGFNAAVDNISQNGPQGADQMALLRAAGFNPQNRNSYYQALERLEDPDQRAEVLRRYEQTVRRRGAGMGIYQRAAQLRRALREVGINRTRTEARGDLGRRVPTRAALAQQMAEGLDAGAGQENVTTHAAGMATFQSSVIAAAQADMDYQAGEGTINANQRLDTKMRSFTLKVVDAGHSLAEFARHAGRVAESMSIFGRGASNPSPRAAN